MNEEEDIQKVFEAALSWARGDFEIKNVIELYIRMRYLAEKHSELMQKGRTIKLRIE